MKSDRKLLFAAWSGHNKNYYAYQTWDAPLKKIFKNFVSFDPQEETYKYGKDEMNRRFLETVRKEQPDYIFLWLIYEEFYIDTLLKIKKVCPKAKLINYCGDDDMLFGTYSIFYSLIIDYFFVTHKEYIPHYKNRAFLSCATNTDQFKPLNIEKKYDVTFIGTPKGDRKEFIRYLMKNGVNLKVFGSGWGDYPEFTEIYGGFLNPDEYTRVINQSKINLCFTKNHIGQTHVIQKFFEINACKVFELTEYSSRYTKLFVDKKELVMFKNKEELMNKIGYYLKHEKEREKIADNAYKRILRDFDKNVEFERLFKKIFDDENKPPKGDLPGIRKKIAKITAEDLRIDEKTFKKRYGEFDYFSFQTKFGQALPYKDYFQMCSLEYSKKPISCCDYYLYSERLGDYLVIFSNASFRNLNYPDFQSLLNLDQIVVSKKFFFKNLEKFKSFFDSKKIDIISEKNTAFVSMPLVRLNKGIVLENEKMDKISWPKFEINIRSALYNRRIFDPGLYGIILSFFSGNKYPLRYTLRKVIGKLKMKSLFS